MKSERHVKDSLPILSFKTTTEWEAWLERQPEDSPGLWLRIYKKETGRPTVTYAEALDGALCFGWIDGIRRRIDEHTYSIRFTPRKPTSIWSAINIAHVERLEREGRMRPAGRAAFARRRDDAQGVYAHEQAEAGELPAAYAALLDDDPLASAFWARATPGYRKQCIHWVLSAKQEATRDRRMGQLVVACRELVAIAPLRFGEEPVWIARARAELGGG